MSTGLIRILIAGALFVHGIGHTLGFFMPARSWLLPNASEPTLRIVSRIFWVLITGGFLLSFLSFLGILVPPDWWRQLAMVFAVVSLLGIGLFWGTWPTFNVIGAIAMNIAVLATQLWLDWPPIDMFGR
jgi:hypothetical protein